QIEKSKAFTPFSSLQNPNLITTIALHLPRPHTYPKRVCDRRFNGILAYSFTGSRCYCYDLISGLLESSFHENSGY
ncbi:9744_t:CDS:2, partial [Racocetra persica]